MTETVTKIVAKVGLLTAHRMERARAVANAGGIEQALESGALPKQADITLSEAIVLGLLRQHVNRFLGVLGHGATEIGEVLRIYEAAGVLRSYGVRSEIEAVHAATALRWVTGEKVAIMTSIGPGALHALAGSLVPLSNGIGVWFLLGDETTEDEGPNMQQIPINGQQLFLRLFSTMGEAYCLHTPNAVSVALRRGLNRVDHPYRAGPFYLLIPMNTQPSMIKQFNLDELPVGAPPSMGVPIPSGGYARVAEAVCEAERVVVQVGGGARYAGPELLEFLELADGVAVTSPLVSGVIPYAHPRNMTVGGSKGSICGNYAMEHADLLVAVGTRFVCQSDCSRTGYPAVEHVININTDIQAAMHYNKTTALLGPAAPTLRRFVDELRRCADGKSAGKSQWLSDCMKKRLEWDSFKAKRYASPCLFDEKWDEEILTQPAVIKAATDWARAHDVVTLFDSGDVQANGFQIVEDDRLGRTFTETGASYMGFAVSALLATALASKPFYAMALSGDGSFTMNPQILIDGVAHGARGCIVVLDNRRMGAISALQMDQYGVDCATSDQVGIDYAAWARSIQGMAAFDGGRSIESFVKALDNSRAHEGLSLIHVPVYYGPDPLGGMGVYGRWNVGNWCIATQALRHKIGL